MGYRRSQRRRQHTSFEDYLWPFVGFVSLVLFFILLNWLGIVLTFVLLGLLLCIFLAFRYGLPSHLLRAQTEIPAYRPAKAVAGGFGLTPPEQVRAEEKAPSSEYGQGYQAQKAPRSTRQAQSSSQPEEERLADYEQPQAQYPEPPPPMA